MINVEQIEINIQIPSDTVRIVAMQPYIKFDSTTREPFKWSNDAVDTQLAAIGRTLDIAKNAFNGHHANYTLFPEYAIPGIAGARIINNKISEEEWPEGSIIIAGIHGITKSEYNELCDMLTAHVSQLNSYNSVLDNQWVNCCVIWVKDSDRLIHKWVQVKVRPSWPEVMGTCNDMFCGSSVYVFECQYVPSGYPCRFVTLICFDWVASVAGATVCHELLEKLTELRAQNLTPLDWVFVIQHNTGPNHPAFLNSTYQFLTDVNTYPFVEHDKAVVIHANTAVSQQPSRNGSGGFSACIFSPSAQVDCNGCRPTVCMESSLLRGSKILRRCKDVVFREMGECIHAFTVRVPRFVNPDVTDRTLPLPTAFVYAMHDTTDPRLCGGAIPAAVKWINDSLDDIEPLSRMALNGCSLEADAEAIEPSIITNIRTINGHTVNDYMSWVVCSFSHGNESQDKAPIDNADLWEKIETDALEHLLYSLISIGLAYELNVTNATLHGSIQTDHGCVQVVAIRGDTYEDFRLHYDNIVPKCVSDPVIVITRDRDNNIPTQKEFLKFFETESESGLVFLDYNTLITNCRNATNINILKGQLNDIIPRDRRII